MRKAMARLKGSRHIWISSFFAIALILCSFIPTLLPHSRYRLRACPDADGITHHGTSRYLYQGHKNILQRRYNMFNIPNCNARLMEDLRNTFFPWKYILNSDMQGAPEDC